MKITVKILPCGVKMVETAYEGGFVEISLYRLVRADAPNVRKLTAVITRQPPGPGNKWVVHTEVSNRALITRVKRDAINWAINYAQKGE